MDVAPQIEFHSASQKSKFRPLLPAAAEPKPGRRDSDHNPTPSAPKIPQEEFPAPQEQNTPRHHPLSQSHLPPPSPPLTPQSSISSDPSLKNDLHIPISPSQTLPTIPPSPYDPLLTPSFRHSPPRLPSDQPWRFPSPSHPLHSRSRELSLSMLIRDTNSPATKSSHVIGESPRMVQASPIPSPRVFGSTGKRNMLDLDTPESLEKLPRPSPRALFSRARLPVSGERARYFIQESPLQHSSRMAPRGHKLSNSELSDDWLSEVSLAPPTSNLDASELLTGGDPFAVIYSPWGNISNDVHEGAQKCPSSPAPSVGAESPVLRSSALPTGIGLGIGLLGPFTLPDDISHDMGDNGFGGMLTYATLAEEEDDEAEVACFLAVSTKDNIAPGTRKEIPPLKKRRMTVEKP